MNKKLELYKRLLEALHRKHLRLVDNAHGQQTSIIGIYIPYKEDGRKINQQVGIIMFFGSSASSLLILYDEWTSLQMLSRLPFKVV